MRERKKKQVEALKVLKPSIQKLLIKDTIPNKIQEYKKGRQRKIILNNK